VGPRGKGRREGRREGRGGTGEEGKGEEGVPECPNPELVSLRPIVIPHGLVAQKLYRLAP